LVREPFLGIVGSASAEGLARFRAGAAGADELLDCFLFCCPRPRPAAPWAPAGLPAEARRAWVQVLARLRRLAGDPARPGRPLPLPLDEDGRAAWEHFYDRLTEEINGEEAGGPLRGPWAGLQAYGARLALVLHYLWWAGLGCTEEANGSCIGPADIERAVVLVEYFQSHARAVYAAWANPTIGPACSVLRWLKRTGFREFSHRQARNALCHTLRAAAQLEARLALLCRHGYLRRKPDGNRQGPGRKPSPVYEVNPLWHGAAPGPNGHFADSEDSAEGGPGPGL
jgi:hypothetical protein